MGLHTLCPQIQKDRVCTFENWSVSNNKFGELVSGNKFGELASGNKSGQLQ